MNAEPVAVQPEKVQIRSRSQELLVLRPTHSWIISLILYQLSGGYESVFYCAPFTAAFTLTITHTNRHTHWNTQCALTIIVHGSARTANIEICKRRVHPQCRCHRSCTLRTDAADCNNDKHDTFNTVHFMTSIPSCADHSTHEYHTIDSKIPRAQSFIETPYSERPQTTDTVI
jgi:hypothetical protein